VERQLFVIAHCTVDITRIALQSLTSV